jgi:16S rRNA processing protein RimM
MVVLTKDKVCVGVITGVRGLKGEVRVKSFTSDPASIASYGAVTTENGKNSFRLTIKSSAKGLLIARLDGIEDRTSAEKLKGEKLFVPRSALPEPETDEFYQADLIGLYVETDDGKRLGVIKAIHNFGASDILEIAYRDGGDKDNMMVPFTSEIVPEVDLKGGRVVINPPKYIDEDQLDVEKIS